MKFNVYIIRDCMSGFLPQLYCYKSDSVATRAMLDTVFAGKPTSTEKDLDVMRIGFIDTDTGEFHSMPSMTIMQGLSVHQKKLAGEEYEIPYSVQQ